MVRALSTETGKTRAAKNKSIRKEALRDQLSAQGHVQHVIDITDKLSDLDITLENVDVTRLKAAADLKLKLINKYLPDLKAVELSGKDGSDFVIKLTTDDSLVL